MDRRELRRLFGKVAAREIDVERALELVAGWPTERLLPRHGPTSVRFDHHRELRTGIPEVVYGEGKSEATLLELFRRAARGGERRLATRVESATGRRIAARIPVVEYREEPRCLLLGPLPRPSRSGGVAILAAGTTDLPVAEEAATTLEFLGRRVLRRYDVGVAGLHRLVAVLPDLDRCRVLVVVAGMEGALPSVVAGLDARPVVAVPTSVGYGASFGGLAALLAMMSSCAPGVAVVNIDNGFGAAVLAAKIDRLERIRPTPSASSNQRRAPQREIAMPHATGRSQ